MCARRQDLSAEQEVDLGRRILELERTLRTTLEAIPACRLLLAEQARGKRATRHVGVEQLTQANLLAQRTPGVDPRLLARAAAAIVDAQALRWELAASAQRVGHQAARKRASSRIPMEDLEQEAMLGLYAAARRFDPERSVRFGAYARWWVRAQLTRAVQLSAPMPPSAAVLQLHRDARKLVAQDAQAGVSRPIFGLAKELGIKPQRLWDVTAAATLRSVETLDDDGLPSAIEALVDDVTPTPEEAASDRDMHRWLHGAIRSSFEERDRHILARRYGFGTEVASIAAIAKSLALSPERVRQLEAESITVLHDQIARAMDV